VTRTERLTPQIPEEPFYRDDASFDRHYSNPALDEGHQKIMDLLADDDEGPDVREHVRIESSS